MFNFTGPDDKVAKYVTYVGSTKEGDKVELLFSDYLMDYEDDIQTYEAALLLFNARVEDVCILSKTDAEVYGLGNIGLIKRREIVIGHASLLARKLQTLGRLQDARNLMLHAGNMVTKYLNW